jgi:hypothetical protein
MSNREVLRCAPDAPIVLDAVEEDLVFRVVKEVLA